MITWDGLAFSLPSTMVDQTVLTFVDNAQAVSVTVSQEPLEGGRAGLLRYVTEQLAEIGRAVPGYGVTSQGERSAGALPGVHVQANVVTGGVKRTQQQLYVLHEARARVFIVTVTAIEGSATQATAMLDALASSIVIG